MGKIKEKEKNFSDWYLETILKADLIDYGPVKGTIVFKPFAYHLWEKIQFFLNQEIKKIGVENAYFPLLIPESFLKKEKEHLKSFSPEVAAVSYAGGRELSEKLIIRPTSETIMYYFFSQWIKSYRDLPLLLNQWNNVVRWEKRPFPFLRNSEFLWQEGHTVHQNKKEAEKFVFQILKIYEKIYQDILCIYGIVGKKSETEKFAGALETYTYEILLPDGKALQSCTSHNLGQNFSKAFNIKFQDKKQKLKYVWQTSWGLATRSLGALVAVHGDHSGMILPPKIAPFPVVIIPIYDGKNDKKVDDFILEIKKFLPVEIYVDNSDRSPGYKFNEWELKGIPLRIEVGDQEIKNNLLTVFRRDKQERFSLTKEEFKNNLENIFQEIEKNLYVRSKKFTQENSYKVNTYEEFKKKMKEKRGFIYAWWCGQKGCEFKIKEETKATTRCLPLNSQEEKGKCVYCQKKALSRWIFAQAY